MNEERFIDIETKLTHQEFLLEQLNQTIYQQQLKIDELETKMLGIYKRFQEALAAGDEIRANEKPPHY
jgi:SlyX protein